MHTVTLSGHCCPICRDQLPFINDQGKRMYLFCLMKIKNKEFYLYILVPISQSHFGLTIIIIFSILILILIFIILILIFILLRERRRSLSPSNQLPTVHHRSPITSHHQTGVNIKPLNIFPYVKYDLISVSNGNNNTNNNPQQGLSLSSNIPLTSLEQTSTHSIIGTNTTTTGTGSLHHELEPGTWTEDDPMLQCSTSTSNDGDEVEEHVIINSDNDESHPQIHMDTGPPTIIYV